MAITTEGFGVNVMPQYTPVDPRLVAFDPAQISNGVLNAFQVVDNYKKMQAFNKAQAELDATRLKRVAATNSGYDASISDNDLRLATNPLAGEAKNATSRAAISLVPQRAALEGLQLAGDIATQPSKNELNALAVEHQQEVQPRKQRLEIADLQQQDADLDLNLQTQHQKALAENQALLRAAELADPKHALDVADVHDRLANQATDAQLRRDKMKLEIANIQAHNEALKAQAAYNLGQGRYPGTPKTIDQMIEAKQRQIKNLSSTKLPSGKTADVYQAETYDQSGIDKDHPYGTLKTGGWIWDRQPVAKDPVGESLLANRRTVQRRLDQLIQSPDYVGEPSIASPGAASSGITPITVPGLSPVRSTPTTSSQAQEALDWAANNPDDPRSALILQKLGIQ